MNLNSIIRRIKNSTKIEPKNSLLIAMKLQEEVGELSAEMIKKEGYTYKDYNPQDLLDEVSDVLIQVLSLYYALVKEKAIHSNPIYFKYSLNKKIDKWKNKTPLIKAKLAEKKSSGK